MSTRSTKINKLDGEVENLCDFDGKFEVCLYYQMDVLLEDMILTLIEKRLKRNLFFEFGDVLDDGIREIIIFDLRENRDAKIIADIFDLLPESKFSDLLKVKINQRE